MVLFEEQAVPVYCNFVILCLVVVVLLLLAF